MKARRAGHGCSSGSAVPLTAPRLAPATHQTGGTHHTLGDDPAARAALERARLDVRAYEQTEAYWKLVWTEEREP